MKIVTVLSLLYALLATSAHAGALSHDKHWGTELNPFRLLLVDDSALSGGISYFDHRHNTEIALPFFHQYRDNSSFPDETYRETTVDLHYRKYLDSKLQGIYLSAFARYARLKGSTYADPQFDSNGNYVQGPTRSTEKLGFGLGIGMRTFFDNGIYLGASLMFGRYISGESDIFTGDDDIVSEDGEQIFDIELLKIGYAF